MKQQTVNAKKGVLMEVDPKLISVKDGFNVRQDYGDIDELMNSILENGLKLPLRAYGKGGKRHIKAAAFLVTVIRGIVDPGKKL